MSRLVKGGKFVYGLSRIGPDGVFIIPPEAMQEYGYAEGDKVIVLNGSRKSGGLVLTTRSLLEKSELDVLIENLPGLASYRIPEGEIIANQGRSFCWTVVAKGGRIRLPLRTLSHYGLVPGKTLAVVRGSYLAIAFLGRGPLLEEAVKHLELEVFGE